MAGGQSEERSSCGQEPGHSADIRGDSAPAEKAAPQKEKDCPCGGFHHRCGGDIRLFHAGLPH